MEPRAGQERVIQVKMRNGLMIHLDSAGQLLKILKPDRYDGADPGYVRL